MNCKLCGRDSGSSCVCSSCHSQELSKGTVTAHRSSQLNELAILCKYLSLQGIDVGVGANNPKHNAQVIIDGFKRLYETKSPPVSDVDKETKDHIFQVSLRIANVVKELKDRAASHDISKTLPPEIDGFREFTPKLKSTHYGSDEYFKILRDMKPFLDNHYATNRHHPEHYKEGIKGMSLIDLLEMLCDWKAATLRSPGGNINDSIDRNQERFKFSDEIKEILRNTLQYIP